MACELTQGSSIDCRDSIGGIRNVYISNFDNASIIHALGVATSITQVATKNFFKYNLEKENGTSTETQTGSIENGTNFYESELSFTVKKLSSADRNEIKLLALSRLFVIVEDNNGVFFTFGAEFGADMLSSTASTGKAFADMSGYSLTFKAKEKEAMIEVPQSVIDTLTIA